MVPFYGATNFSINLSQCVAVCMQEPDWSTEATGNTRNTMPAYTFAETFARSVTLGGFLSRKVSNFKFGVMSCCFHLFTDFRTFPYPIHPTYHS